MAQYNPRTVFRQTSNPLLREFFGCLPTGGGDDARGEIGLQPDCPYAPNRGLRLARHWAFWRRYDRAMLERCDELVVLQLDGWEESIGVKAEIAIAKELNLPDGLIDTKTRKAGRHGKK